MKYLIISDIHNKIRIVDQITQHATMYGCDKRIYTGDYFDSFYDNADMARETANWVKGKLKDDTNIMLIGNHCQAYVWVNNSEMRCSGFTKEKAKAIYSVLTKEELLQLKLYYAVDNVIFSHAGVSANFLDLMVSKGYSEPFEHKIDIIGQKLNEWQEKAIGYLSVGNMHPLYEAGYNRGGSSPHGGLTWCDLGEFKPIKGIVNVFGHSPVYPNHCAIKLFNEKNGHLNLSYPEKESRDLSHMFAYGFGLDLDSHLEGFGIYDDEKKRIEVYKVGFNISHKEDELGNKGRQVIGSELIWSKEIGNIGKI